MRPSKCRPSTPPVMLLAVCLLAAGCVSARRDQYIQEKASQHVYRQPLAEVWPQVRSLFKEKELPLREVPGSFEIATDWHPVGGPSSLGTNYVRFYVRGRQPSPVSCTVEIFRHNRTVAGEGPVNSQTGQREELGTDATNVARDREMEWELMQRVDPEAARALLDEAKTSVK